MEPVAWTRLQVTVAGEAAEAAADFLRRLGSPGLQVEEEGGRIRLTGYLPGRNESACSEVEGFLHHLRRGDLTVGPGEVAVDYLRPTDWMAMWRDRLRPVRAGRRLLVRPSWLTVPDEDQRITIVIDPQMAFGTGHHATTRFCLRALEDLVRQGDRVLDLGAGSGILSIAAVKLGAGRVLGLDNDDQAVATARENIRINAVDDRVEISGREVGSLAGRSFEVVAANIDGPTLLPLLPRLASLTTAGGHLILAGLLDREEDALRRRLADLGLDPARLEHCEEWVAVVVCIPQAEY
jgi:ribosomal protein L11 methyltransferase